MDRAVNIESGIGRRVGVFAVAILSWVWLGTGFAQESKANLNALIQETQKQAESPGEVVLVWWLPEEFWQVSFAQNPQMTAAQAEVFIAVLRPYMVVVAVAGKIGPFGGITYKSEPLIRSSIQLIDHQGGHYSPLSEEAINADTKNFISMMTSNSRYSPCSPSLSSSQNTLWAVDACIKVKEGWH